MNENELDLVLCRMVDWDSERARDSSRYRAQSPDKDHSKLVRRQLSKSPVLVSSIVTRTVATRDERSSLSMSGFGLCHALLRSGGDTCPSARTLRTRRHLLAKAALMPRLHGTKQKPANCRKPLLLTSFLLATIRLNSMVQQSSMVSVFGVSIPRFDFEGDHR